MGTVMPFYYSVTCGRFVSISHFKQAVFVYSAIYVNWDLRQKMP